MDAVWLNLLILLPLAGAVAAALWPRERLAGLRHFALAIGLLCAFASLLLWLRVGPEYASGRLVGESRISWIAVGDLVRDSATGRVTPLSPLKISYHVGLDPISAPLIALTGILVPLSIACGFSAIRHRQKEYYAWLLALTAGMFGVFAARDVLLFYIFFEFTLIPLYFLIGVWGGPERRFAATKFFLYTFVGSVITFAGILYLAMRGATTGGLVDFDLVRLSNLGLTATEQSWLFLAFFCGFAIKVPFFPLHTWLPLAHTEAPTAGSVLLAGVLLKLGTYGFLRFSLPMVPEGALAWAQVMAFLAVAGIIYGALISWVQRDIKKLVAYSSVSHLGFCMLGMFSFLPVGLSGSVLYMVNHGLSTGALFLVIGMIYERYHTRDVEQIGGLARTMPVMAFFLVLFVLSSVGLPGLNGFVSEFTTLLAAFNSQVLGTPWYGILGASGILLGAIYLLYMTGKVLFGPLKEPLHEGHAGPDLSGVRTRDLNPREIAILTPLAILVVLLGFFPRLITDSLDPALKSQVLARVWSARPELLTQAGASAADHTAASRAGPAESSDPLGEETPAAAPARAAASGTTVADSSSVRSAARRHLLNARPDRLADSQRAEGAAR